MLRRATATSINQMLQDVVRRGTGRRAALADRPVAGKTGTTENYGDAWFVGYTPQLVTAVWVGYPNTLRPMETEFDGDPVAGGTFPALIWKTFTEAALRVRGDKPATFASPPFLSGSSKRVVRRDGRVLLDNGICRGALSVVYFTNFGPKRTANCKPNEVDVPNVVGQPLARRAGPARRPAARVGAGGVARQAAPARRPRDRAGAEARPRSPRTTRSR